MRSLYSNKGMSILELLVAAGMLIFIIMPVFAIAAERYVVLNKVQVITDAVDITNMAAYSSINAQALSSNEISFDSIQARKTYERLLAKNLHLNSDLTPLKSSVADGQVVIRELVLHREEFPWTCPGGTVFNRPAVHSCIIVPLKPSLYRYAILRALNKEYLELEVHVDSEIPVNN